MGGQSPLRRRLAALARDQHGVVTRWQMLRLGLTTGQVEGWVSRGGVLVIHRGVYLVGPIEGTYCREMAGVLACGPGAAISHRSAIHVYGLLPYPAKPGPVHVTRPGHHRRGPKGVIAHRTSRLLPYEIRDRDGVPVTAPVRTLTDFAADDATDDELERAVAEAFALRLTQRAPLLREVERQSGKRGTKRLRTLLDGAGPQRTRSTPERELLRGLRGAGVGGFETNARLGRWEADFYWPAAGLVVEVDAYSTHSSPWAFERDRRKTAALEDLGLKVRHITKRRIDHELPAVVAEIQRLIGRGGG